ncbi:DNA internalization-related competence protein ComEC/Rec2 [Candidimonas sp. SYP-B2681]|uniref:DNA internalization-related competence protein ComEC/Rec2 n=1 Tax=Candidimonas sp. SYP-B2681 TaxID=2497686 RepID=UPI000F89B5B8|nr:DNA internalization-related competence protein ComEC/Rec2 [Candidimonas sp. SYP-B2681]RTZ47804.1 DNA internalization-related competence protein ComEC/Rec2 [Candidimonas sp. SYP-B2681]
MTGRICLLAFVAATGAVHCFPFLPNHAVKAGVLAAAGMASTLAYWLAPQYRWRTLLPLWAALAGLLLTIARAEHRLADALDASNENKVSRVVLRVAALPRLGPDSRQFEAEVLSSIPQGVPSRIQVSWTAPNWAGPYGRRDRASSDDAKPYFPEIIPGQVWRMSLTLKNPNGNRNPHAFDYESYLFAHGIRATGSVRGTPLYMGDEPWASLPVIAQRARYYVRAAMQPYLEGKRYGAVLLALAIGDQASVDAADWQVFNRTGITHLVSISGSHITMIAALAGSLVFLLWRRLRFRHHAWAERLPAQVAGAMAALLLAWLYCLLAGWGVPARRTFLMLLVVALAYLLKLPLNASRLLSLVAFAVVILDPWALMASGFWLSFGAVYVLMASAGWWGHPVGKRPVSRWQRCRVFIATATRLQLAITVGLMPLLALIFYEVSLVSPLANVYAIPVISVVVTPLSLLLAGASLVPGFDYLATSFAWLGHAALEFTMVPTVWLADFRAANFNVAAAPLWLTLIAMLGLLLAVMPYGIPYRNMAWLFMLPALLWSPPRPPQGGWNLYALDVGQASAIVVQTARHSLLFDTGLRSSATSDDGARTIWPFLRSKGIKKLNVLVVSHADIDHAGGVRSLLQAMPVEQSYSSFSLSDYLEREAGLLGAPGHVPPLPLAMSACEYGMTWHIDGVAFEFLWPLKPPATGRAVRRRQRNDYGCVLRIRGQHHSVLLPGDIGTLQEASLLDRGLGHIDVVLAAHHGSKNSSSDQFVSAVGASHVIAQAGLWNRYGHPSPLVERRWQDYGAAFWRTDQHGAITMRSRAAGLLAYSERQFSPRYWQTR